MTDETTPAGPPGPQRSGDADTPRPWWYGGGEGLPDMESILGPEGMEAVGGVAEEALKLFVVLRDRVSEAGAAGQGSGQQAPGGPASGPPGGPAGGWGAMLGQFAAGAMKAVNDFAATAGQAPTVGQGGAEAGDEPAPPGHPVPPGQAAACSYCPICQVIAMFRSVPMSTWQRLASSVLDVADAARDAATAAAAGQPVVITPTGAPAAQRPGGPVADFLDDLEHPTPGE